MTALLWASLKGHLPVVRELVNVYKVDLFQKDKVRLTHALVTVHYYLSYRTTYVHGQTTCDRPEAMYVYEKAIRQSYTPLCYCPFAFT